MLIPIFSRNGNESNLFEIDDKIQFVNGRVSKGEVFYYKGIGTLYSDHFVDNIENEKQYSKVEKSDVFYLGYKVKKKCYVDKFGIFEEPYQPMFDDYIGACGNKEFSIIENSDLFLLSSVRFETSVKVAPGQYYFKLQYRCGRRKYIEDGDPLQLAELLEYMIAENWNFIWDKDSINDISYNGLVTDVADLFHSNKLKSQFGTVYSVLYSLARHPKQNAEFLSRMGATSLDVIANVVYLLKLLGAETSLLKHRSREDLIRSYLINGRNCGDCCFIDIGDRVREGYIQQVDQL